MTKDQLDELEKLEHEATRDRWYLLDSPWVHSDHARLTIVAGHPDPHKGILVADFDLDMEWSEDESDPRIQEEKDARFVATARNQMKSLIALARFAIEAKGALEWYGDYGARTAELDDYGRNEIENDQGDVARAALERWPG